MFKSIPSRVRRKLWEHQRKAVDFTVGHLKMCSSPCLVRMPTGTGKTGVIACLTILSNTGCSLVLTPWRNLRDQMVDHLERKFWSDINVDVPKRNVKSILPSSTSDILKDIGSGVVVSTFATINYLRRKNQAVYKELSNAISLVIVDEGHYEPAVEWGKSVKGLRAKTVLFTATPYRNDLKLFQITDPAKSVHHFMHRDAVERGIIRKVRFQTLNASNDIRYLSTSFAEVWTELKSGVMPSINPRAIICCRSHEDIEQVVIRLTELSLSAIGIHDKFKEGKNSLFHHSVPDPQKESAEIWVHQNKLTEGLDDSRFCCLGLFTSIRNDRKLIQQIGRILRRKPKDLAEDAVVISSDEFSPEDRWNTYLLFETELKLLDPAHFHEVVDKILEAQPLAEYFDGRFRKRFEPSKLPINPQVVFSPSVLVRKKELSFELDNYIQDCTDTLNVEDAVILGPDINHPCRRSDDFALWVYATVSNSRFLERTSLYEVQLQTHCVSIVGDYIFIADSRGNLPREYLDENSFPIDQAEISNFMDESFKPTELSLVSTVLYDNSVRGSRLHGHNLLAVPPSLTDRIHICRGMRGSSVEAGRRYVGFSNGRIRQEITEHNRRNYNLDTYLSWTQFVATILSSADLARNKVFSRYMSTCDAPDPTIPKTLCLDLQRDDLALYFSNGLSCELRDATVDVLNKSTENRNIFSTTFYFKDFENSHNSLTLHIEFDQKKRRFWFHKEKGKSVHVKSANGKRTEKQGFAQFLNMNQDMLLMGLEGGEIVYQNKSFYKIDYTHAERVLLDLIDRPQGDLTCRTEKGTTSEIDELKKSVDTKFPINSLFRAINDGEIVLPVDPEIMICDDMGTECADFLVVNFQKKQMALIHAKAGSGSKISASAFHDVVSQAMKNLCYLTPNPETPDGVKSWWRGAKWNRTKINRVSIPAGYPVKEKLWNKIRSEIIESANPELFVILVTTGACNLSELTLAVTDPTKRTPETAQLMHLLDGLNCHSRQLGVKLKVFDIPFDK